MKTLGMIGGLGPESTIDYYRNIIAIYRERQCDGSYPQVILNAIDLTRALTFLNAGKLEALADFLLREIEKLQRAGADFAIISANTPHIVFDEISSRSPIPLISIVAATCARARARRMRRLGLFGTKFTMQADFYHKAFALESIELVVPNSNDQDFIHEKYMVELLAGNFLPQTLTGLLAIVDRMKAESAIDGVVLAGTELPLIVRGETHNDVAFLDTGKIHCQAAVDEMLMAESTGTRQAAMMGNTT